MSCPIRTKNEEEDFSKDTDSVIDVNISAVCDDESAASRPTTELGRPTLPKGTKLITFPVAPTSSSGSSHPPQSPSFSDAGSSHQTGAGISAISTREWILNPAGKSYVCILHEYVQHALKKQPCYQFKEIGLFIYFNFNFN